MGAAVLPVSCSPGALLCLEKEIGVKSGIRPCRLDRYGNLSGGMWSLSGCGRRHRRCLLCRIAAGMTIGIRTQPVATRQNAVDQGLGDIGPVHIILIASPEFLQGNMVQLEDLLIELQ